MMKSSIVEEISQPCKTTQSKFSFVKLLKSCFKGSFIEQCVSGSGRKDLTHFNSAAFGSCQTLSLAIQAFSINYFHLIVSQSKQVGTEGPSGVISVLVGA